MTHRIASLLAFLDCEYTDEDVAKLNAIGSSLRSDHEWVLGPPLFVDEVTPDGTRNVGLLLQIHAAFDEEGHLLEEETDRAHFREVVTLIHALQVLAADNELEVGLELDGESVGWVEGGELTDSLRVGLLDSWAARFAD